MNAIQPEFQGFPVSQLETSSESVTSRFLRLSEAFGPLVPQNLLASALGVGRARVHQFMEAGRFRVLEVDGTKFVPLDEVRNFQRKVAGRPKKSAAA